MLTAVRLIDATSTGGSIHELARQLGATESQAHAAQVLLLGPLRIFVIVGVAFLVTRVVPGLCRRLVRSLQLRTPLGRASKQADNRAATVSGVLASVFRAIVWVVAFLTVLGGLGINLAPFVATATVIGAAVGFGAQSLVKDFLSGLLIVIEDQYGVGDSITVGDTTGTVEGLSLRITRVRGLDGMVWFIPNGEIRKVGNSSEGFSQAIVDVDVPAGTDVTRAGQLAEEEACAVAAEPEWHDVILEQPVLWGVQQQTHEAVTIRVVARTTPGDSARVTRVVRARIIERLRREGVAWATPGDAGAPAAVSPLSPVSPVSPDGGSAPPGPARS